MKKYLLLPYILPGLVLYLLVSCQASQSSTANEPTITPIFTDIPLLNSATPQASATLAPSATYTPDAIQLAQTPTVPDFSLPSTPTPLPSNAPQMVEQTTLPPTQQALLELLLPTPAQAPVSLWRPPLYNVPWSPRPFDHFYFMRPIAADEVNWPLADYRYGATFFGPDIVHTGIDIDAPRGTPVQATGAGTVTWAGNGLYFGKYDPRDPYGLAVVIEHDFGYKGNSLYTVYAHMDRIDVKKDQRVETGSQLGLVGNTGLTTGAHLHFELRIGKNSFFVTRNPELWISPPQGWGILVGRVMNERNGLVDKLDIRVISKADGQMWKIRTYALLAVNSDDYYRENLVLSDLPAGDYHIEFDYLGQPYAYEIVIQPGIASYFSFHARHGFSLEQPVAPVSMDWLNTPTPKAETSSTP